MRTIAQDYKQKYHYDYFFLYGDLNIRNDMKGNEAVGYLNSLYDLSPATFKHFHDKDE